MEFILNDDIIQDEVIIQCDDLSDNFIYEFDLYTRCFIAIERNGTPWIHRLKNDISTVAYSR